MAIVYQYDTDGFFIGPCDDCGGPMPHGCDSIGPPTAMPDGSPIPDFSRFRKVGPGKFDVVEDHRGRVGHVPPGEAQAITTWGPLPEGWREGEPEPVPPTLEETRTATVAAINAAYEQAMTAIRAEEPPSALLTYSEQRTESEGWMSNTDTPTPMLDTLAGTRGLEKAELVRRVLVKASLYKPVSGLLLGQQQRLIDDVTAIMEADLPDDLKIVALEQLNINIALPGVEV